MPMLTQDQFTDHLFQQVQLLTLQLEGLRAQLVAKDSIIASQAATIADLQVQFRIKAREQAA